MVDLPVLAGSGISPTGRRRAVQGRGRAIVGSTFKKVASRLTPSTTPGSEPPRETSWKVKPHLPGEPVFEATLEVSGRWRRTKGG